MSLTCSSTWIEHDNSVSLQSILGPTSASEDSGKACIVSLRRPPDGGSCKLILQGGRLAGSKLSIVSSSRSCEVSIQCSGDAAPSYVTTIRAQPVCNSSSDWFEAEVPLQELPKFDQLHLKLLSLQNDKNMCSIRRLAVTGEAAAGSSKATKSARDSSAVSDATTSPAVLSQRQEIRLLNQQLMQDGATAGSGVVPPSLQLLMSKALQQPDGAAASVKALSAHVAQGMLIRHSQQQQKQQHCAARHSAAAAAIADAFPAKPAGNAEAQHGAQTTVMPTPSAGDNAVGVPVQCEAVLQALARLELKVDLLTNHLLPAVQRLEAQMAALEARTSLAASQQPGHC